MDEVEYEEENEDEDKDDEDDKDHYNNNNKRYEQIYMDIFNFFWCGYMLLSDHL